MSAVSDIVVDNECVAYCATTVGGPRPTRFSLPGWVGWQEAEAGAPGFGVEIDGRWVEGSTNLPVERVEQVELDEAVERRVTLGNPRRRWAIVHLMMRTDRR